MAKKVFIPKLIMMLVTIHEENPGKFLDANKPIPIQFIDCSCSKPLPRCGYDVLWKFCVKSK